MKTEFSFVDGIFTLNKCYSTTRIVTHEPPILETHPDDTFQTLLSLPIGEGRQSEGGLRTQGYFKHSLPDKPLITVITVVYNGAAHLEGTIQSVIGQTYDNVEYIMIDGGSTDGTLEIIRKYEHAIDYWVSEKDQGIYYAMNKGIKLSSGDSIGIINSDDWYELDTITKIKTSNDLTNIISHGQLKIYNNHIEMYTQKSHNNFSLLKKGMVIAHPTVFVGKNIYKSIGLFDCNFKTAADWELILRLYKKGYYFNNIPYVLANFRIGGISTNISIESSKEKSKIRAKHKLFLIFDMYFYMDMLKTFLFGRNVHKISLLKNRLFAKYYD